MLLKHTIVKSSLLTLVYFFALLSPVSISASGSFKMNWLETIGGYNGGGAATGINNNGVIVGFLVSDDSHQIRPSIWKDGKVKLLETLGGSRGYATTINDHGEIVGYSTIVTGANHAFLWRDNQTLDLGTLGGENSTANNINNKGQVVGYSQTPSGKYHAFLWENGIMTDLGTLGGDNSIAYDINNKGYVVGYSSDESHKTHAILWKKGHLIDLGVFGGAGTAAYGINDYGQIVGKWTSSDEPGHCHDNGFLWDKGKVTILKNIGVMCSFAYEINNHGEIIGSGEVLPQIRHAFSWKNGTLTDLGTLGIGSDAQDVNSKGQIVGQMWDEVNGIERQGGFLWSKEFHEQEELDEPKDKVATD